MSLESTKSTNRKAYSAERVAEGPTLYLESVYFHDKGTPIWLDEDQHLLNRKFKRLSRRALLMAGPDDIVIVDGRPEEEYLELLQRLGAGGRVFVPSRSDGASLMDDIANDSVLAGLVKTWDGPMETYMPSPADDRLSEAINAEIATTPWMMADMLNDKIFFQRILEDVGLNSIDFFIGNCDAISAKEKEWTGPVIIKAARSVGGSRIMTTRSKQDRDALYKFLNKAPKNESFVMQPLLNVVSSPNVQIYIDNDDATLFTVTQQLLAEDGVSHFGNLFDPPPDSAIYEKLMEQSFLLAGEAASLGWRGTLGIDFIVDDKKEVHPIEFNARHNTSTHAAWLFNRLSTGDSLNTGEEGKGALIRFSNTAERTPIEWLSHFGDSAFNMERLRGLLPYDLGGNEVTLFVMGDDTDDRQELILNAKEVVYS